MAENMDAAERLEAPWRALAASLVAGLAHDLNGRLGTLIGLSHLARGSGSVDTDLLELLDEQVRRLRDAVHLLRGIPFVDGSPPVAVRLADALGFAVRLYRSRGGADPAAVHLAGTDPAAVLVREAPFLEGILLLLSLAERSGARLAVVEVTYGNDAGEAWVRIRRGPATSASSVDALSPVVLRDPVRMLEAAGARLGRAGARLVAPAGDVYEVRLDSVS
jgi:signal transduction histidine kinase